MFASALYEYVYCSSHMHTKAEFQILIAPCLAKSPGLSQLMESHGKKMCWNRKLMKDELLHRVLVVGVPRDFSDRSVNPNCRY